MRAASRSASCSPWTLPASSLADSAVRWCSSRSALIARDLCGRDAERREPGVAIGAQRVGLLLRGAERGELGIAIGAQRVGLRLGAVQRVEVGVALGADGVSLPRGVFEGIGERVPFDLVGGALFRRFSANGVELLLGFDAIQLQARLGFLEGERACGTRRRAGFFAGRVRQPIDELADRRLVGRGGAGERGRERFASHVDRHPQGFELGQRGLGGLRDERSNGCGGLRLRVVVERR